MHYGPEGVLSLRRRGEGGLTGVARDGAIEI
jgi:hypothetical protein